MRAAECLLLTMSRAKKKPAERFRASGLMIASYEFASHTAAGTVSCDDDGDGGAPVAA